MSKTLNKQEFEALWDRAKDAYRKKQEIDNLSAKVPREVVELDYTSIYQNTQKGLPLLVDYVKGYLGERMFDGKHFYSAYLDIFDKKFLETTKLSGKSYDNLISFCKRVEKEYLEKFQAQNPLPAPVATKTDITAYLQRIITNKDYTKKNQLYVELNSQEMDFELVAEEKLFDDEDLEGFGEEEDDEQTYAYKEDTKEPRKAPILEIAQDTNRFLIVGESGTGKSTTLAKILFQKAEACLQNSQRKIPILLEAGKYSLSYTFEIQIERALPNAKKMLEQGVLLLVDSLNEINEAVKTQAHAELADWLQRYPHTDFVITSRHTNKQNYFGLPVFELKRLDENQIRTFVGKYLPTQQPAIVQAINEKTYLQNLATNPLHLAMMMRLFKEGKGHTIENKGQLFGLYIDSIFEREKKKGDTLDTPTKYDILMYLAYQSRNEGFYRQIPKSKALAWIKECVSTDDLKNAYYQSFCYNNLFEEQGDYLVWYHESYGEYFTTCYLQRIWERTQPLPVDVYDLKWFEPLMMMADRLKDRREELCNILLCTKQKIFVSAQWEKAERLLDFALQINDINIQHWYSYFVSLRLQGKYDMCINLYRTLPHTRRINKEIGICYEMKGDYEKALTIFEKDKNDSNSSLLGVVRCYMKMENYKEAIKYCEILFKRSAKKSKKKNLKFDLGMCYKMTKEYKKAIEVFEQILTEQPSNVQARNEMGICYRLNGEVQKSIDLFYEAIQLNPDNSYLQFQLFISQGELSKYIYTNKKRLGVVLNVFRSYVMIFAVEEQFFISFEVPTPQDYPLYQVVEFSLDEIIKIVPKEAIRSKFFIESTIACVFPDKQEGFIYNLNKQPKQGKDYFFDYDACDFEPQVGDKVHFIPVLNSAKKYQGKPVAVLIKKAVHICQIRNCYNKMTHWHIEAFDVHTNAMLKFDQELPQKLKRGQQFYYEKQGSKMVLLEERK